MEGKFKTEPAKNDSDITAKGSIAESLDFDGASDHTRSQLRKHSDVENSFENKEITSEDTTGPVQILFKIGEQVQKDCDEENSAANQPIPRQFHKDLKAKLVKSEQKTQKRQKGQGSRMSREIQMLNEQNDVFWGSEQEMKPAEKFPVKERKKQHEKVKNIIQDNVDEIEEKKAPYKQSKTKNIPKQFIRQLLNGMMAEKQAPVALQTFANQLYETGFDGEKRAENFSIKHFRTLFLTYSPCYFQSITLDKKFAQDLDVIQKVFGDNMSSREIQVIKNMAYDYFCVNFRDSYDFTTRNMDSKDYEVLCSSIDKLHQGVCLKKLFIKESQEQAKNSKKSILNDSSNLDLEEAVENDSADDDDDNESYQIQLPAKKFKLD